MCLAIPGKVVEIKGEVARVDYNGEVQRDANCSLVECKVGDYVIVQAGFVVEIVDKRRAKEMYKIL